ncbi:hypothetical protein [Liquorilactobacillus oeni]|uniref:Uncharacterized protein n=1 Tax=Liquorilactobacillus oeni DSM 19972 TaxID=1423777 RepID=A0A0R1M7R1_9LACO|nr:hypothetical protein [Liquorilactobacillus oeni]KRL04134.1 hypothetical protein FD46_GL001251 [Liquorilactobacillus oeni DSM 19972]
MIKLKLTVNKNTTFKSEDKKYFVQAIVYQEVGKDAIKADISDSNIDSLKGKKLDFKNIDDVLEIKVPDGSLKIGF